MCTYTYENNRFGSVLCIEAAEDLPANTELKTQVFRIKAIIIYRSVQEKMLVSSHGPQKTGRYVSLLSPPPSVVFADTD